MNTLLWILQIVLALVFAGAGLMKLIKSRSDLAEQLGDWAANIPAPLIKLLGLAELAGAVGLIVPPLVGVLPVLTPLAAIGLVIVQAGAVVIHGRRSEYTFIAGNLVFIAMAVAVAVLRLGAYSF